MLVDREESTQEWRRIHKAPSISCNYVENGYPHKDVLFWVYVSRTIPSRHREADAP